MATGKRKNGVQDGVLGSLPATRPSRLSRRAREGAADAGAAKPDAAAAKPAAKPKAAAAKKPAAKKPATTAKKPAAAKGATVTPAKPRKPKAVRPTTPALKEPIARAKERAADEPTDRSEAPIAQAPSGKELASTVVQAAGELVQIGATVGGQIIKRAIERLPKP